MDDLYSLAIVGAGLSSLSAIRSGIVSERAIVLDYQDAPGGFLREALPAHGFEEAWDLIESSVRAALAERALTDRTARTDIRTVAVDEHPRLRGAAALVAAPAFAAPMVA